MARVHVLAADWLPAANDPWTAPGMRGAQIVAALRAAGHAVTVSVPRESRTVRTLLILDPARPRGAVLHDADNQATVLREARPDVVIWQQPQARKIPFETTRPHICDLASSEASIGPATGRCGVVQACRFADLLLTGSAEQHGYWLAELSRSGAPPPVIVAGYAPLGSVASPGAADQPLRLSMCGDVQTGETSPSLLSRVAAWAGARQDVTLTVDHAPGAELGGDLAALRALAALRGHANITVRQDASVAAVMAGSGSGGVWLELGEPGSHRELAVPHRAVHALCNGVPVLASLVTPLTRRLARAGAGWIAAGGEELEPALDRLAARTPEEMQSDHDAALRFAAAAFDPADAARAIRDGVAEALDRHNARLRTWSAPGAGPPDRIGHVLVFTGESANLRELRVDVPFRALHRKRLITGYSIVAEGRVVATTSSDRDTGDADARFDAIWVQRSVSAEVALVLHAMGAPFVYDLDDNLLVSPAYRSPFAPEHLQAARGFLRACAVLSCSTARLPALIEEHTKTELASKAIVTPNLAATLPRSPPAGAPGAVIWASSDVPALTVSRRDVVQAIRDFCLAHRLRLVSVGARPDPAFRSAGVEVDHVGQLGYAAYLELLRSMAPAILVCPLETDGDRATQAFVDCKSDIKILEALLTGVVGVFSAAVPYLDSELPPPILCTNSYAGWLRGLELALARCGEGVSAPAIPAFRQTGELGTLPWHLALTRARLVRPVALTEMNDALVLIRGRFGRRKLSAEEFDANFYMANYADVRLAIDRGTLGSAYEHYAVMGFAEGRLGREGDSADSSARHWWANLHHTVSDIRASADARDSRIAELRAMLTARRNLRG